MVVASFSGLGMAGSLAMTSALSADIFGRFSVGSIFGLIFLVHQMGAALGSGSRASSSIFPAAMGSRSRWRARSS